MPGPSLGLPGLMQSLTAQGHPWALPGPSLGLPGHSLGLPGPSLGLPGPPWDDVVTDELEIDFASLGCFSSTCATNVGLLAKNSGISSVASSSVANPIVTGSFLTSASSERATVEKHHWLYSSGPSAFVTSCNYHRLLQLCSNGNCTLLT